MPLLYYWRGDIYRHDLDVGVGYHLNQANPLLHEIEIGESLWAFTRTSMGSYALAAELVVSAKTRNPEGFPYGPYRVWGNLHSSRYFVVDNQPDVTEVIRSLNIRTGGAVLGQSFQGRAAVRRINDVDHVALSEYATSLVPELRARLLPEELLEASLISGDENSIMNLLGNNPSGVSEDRRNYLISRAAPAVRDRRLIHELQRLYDGACQICGWTPRANYGVDICEGHHVRWLSRGGVDDLTNLVLICPNHHRAIHRTDAPYDYRVKAFVFSTNLEFLNAARHEIRAQT